jgi:mRNA interferase RelE/StbE
METIYGHADNLRPTGYKKQKGRDGYRIRVADYRIIYDIFDDVLLVDVIDLGHRKDIYE